MSVGQQVNALGMDLRVDDDGARQYARLASTYKSCRTLRPARRDFSTSLPNRNNWDHATESPASTEVPPVGRGSVNPFLPIKKAYDLT